MYGKTVRKYLDEASYNKYKESVDEIVSRVMHREEENAKWYLAEDNKDLDSETIAAMANDCGIEAGKVHRAEIVIYCQFKAIITYLPLEKMSEALEALSLEEQKIRNELVPEDTADSVAFEELAAIIKSAADQACSIESGYSTFLPVYEDE